MERTVVNLKGRTVEGVTTTAGERFTPEDSVTLAKLVLKRFGYDKAAAAAAWRRLLGNGCSDDDFEVLAGAVVMPAPGDPDFRFCGGSAIDPSAKCPQCGSVDPCECYDEMLGR